ncbi:unnamed protein product [Echinostoma caproni]|uniref:WW domain-containing protein n=1 Tax=Echinostoma caproni TaxID=27848 RepID=A0A3P8IH76_9TREM|nr:unnamed protein product [Echinostoma caproni]
MDSMALITNFIPSQQRLDPNGRPYFVNHISRTSQWEDPRFQGCSLPPGWEMRVTPEGFPFFVNHNDKITTFFDPRRADSKYVWSWPPSSSFVQFPFVFENDLVGFAMPLHDPLKKLLPSVFLMLDWMGTVLLGLNDSLMKSLSSPGDYNTFHYDLYLCADMSVIIQSDPF